MSLKVTGTVQQIAMGTGTWTLETQEGITYELYQAPSALQQPGLKVTVDGEVREDIMTMAMVGPVLEVKSFETVA